MTSLKQDLKDLLIHRQHQRYDKEMQAKNLTYDQWIRDLEREAEIECLILDDKEKSLTNDSQMEGFGSSKSENEGYKSKTDDFCHFITLCGKKGKKSTEMTFSAVSALQFSAFKKQILTDHEADVILISMYRGEMSEIAYGLLYREFRKDRNIILIYGDEDVKEGDTRREPWFKPDWSPDRFLSCFYFGGLVAVKAAALRKAWEAVPAADLYQLLFRMILDGHGFEKHGAACDNRESAMPVRHIRQILFHGREEGCKQLLNWKLPGEPLRFLRQPALLVSVIIPSRDNPQVLFRCMDTFLVQTRTGYACEIIVVDNGSREENRALIADRIAQMDCCSYLYEPMEFNFSRMCNLGAQKAQGDMLLFLNDDMEIIQKDWLELMIEKAELPYAGAVGAKLLYPHSTTIQHAGITNLRVGPAHKLQLLDDGKNHYFGMNRGVHDMMAVTGACLMVRRSVFEETGGFAGELAVAFNDVDLCYRIYELGYYNIVRNDVILYHHESLSRGRDGESEEKQLRLQKEKDILYERHQELYGRDPFYHPGLTADMLESEYSPAYRYQVDLSMAWSRARRWNRKVERAREDPCLVVGMEAAMDIYKWKYGVPASKGKYPPGKDDMGYYFQGYSFIIGADNACYQKWLLLKNQQDGTTWRLPLENQYRQDIRNNLQDQLNVDLTGFAAKLRAGSIPPGIYQFGMLAKDKCSRQRLINWSNWVLEVKADEK